jgi:hypothetical protein
MIGQMKVLLRVKELKQDQAFRAMQKKRNEVIEAERLLELARQTVAESARTLGSREDAIYSDVIGQIVDLDALDHTRGRVVQLEKDHTRLKDEADRTAHVQNRLEGELEVASQHYKGAVRVRDKYVLITDEMKREADEIVVYKEEAEIEDLFSRPMKKPA